MLERKMFCDPDVIQQMKDEHAEIFYVLGEVARQQPHSRQSKKLLNKNRELIVRHIEHENAAVYPYVKQASETDAVLERILDIMDTSTDQVLKTVVEFFDLLDQDPLPEDVDRDFELVSTIIKNRIIQEETILFKIIPEIKE